MRFLLLFSAALLGLAGASGWAAVPTPVRASLVKDLDTRPGPRSSQPSLFTTLAGRVYFSASAPGTGQELYSTDAQGDLRFLGDIAPGARGSLPEPLAVVGGRLIATADDGLTGRQFWSLPVGGGQPLRLTSVADYWLTPPHSAEVIATLANRVLLRTTAQNQGLWSIDGTTGGTYHRTTASGFPLDTVSDGCVLQDAAVLSGTASSQPLLVRSTGLPGGDSVIATLPQGSWPRAAIAAGGACYFLLGSYASTVAWSLWRTDGTPQGSMQVATATGFTAQYLASIGNAVYWLDSADSASPGEAQTRLWRLAAGAAQAQLVVDLPGPFSVNGPLWTHEGLLLFNAFARVDDRFEHVLYASDGSTAGTRRLYPAPGQSGWNTFLYPVPGGIVLDTYNALDLRIDLSSGAVTTIDSGAFNFDNSALLGGVRIGLGEPYGGDREVWITTGTPGSTRALNDVWADTASGLQETGTWAAIGERLFFTHGSFQDYNYPSRVLWRSDGTETGTTMLARDQYQANRGVSKVLRYGDSGVLFTNDYWYTHLYYADAALSSATLAVADIHGEFLQSTDNGLGAIFPCSTAAALCGIHPGTGGSVLADGNFAGSTPIGSLGRVAIFSTLVGSPEIWRSDGTPAGTYRLLADRSLRGAASAREQQLQLDGKLYFVSCSSSYACDLTVTDGTVAGTTFLLPVSNPGISWSARAGSRLVMSLGDYVGQLWSTDGTVAGTQLLRSGDGSQFASTGDAVHMSFSCDGCKQSRLITDGTPAGTRLLDLPAGLRSATGFAAVLGPQAIVFSCQNGARGIELCLSNANGDDVVPLPEMFPGSYGSDPVLIGRTDAAVYFSADDGVHGRELWQLRLLEDAVFADGFD